MQNSSFWTTEAHLIWLWCGNCPLSVKWDVCTNSPKESQTNPIHLWHVIIYWRMMSLRLDDTRKTPEDYFLKSWKMPLLSPLMQEPFMCEHFFRAIYLRIKEDPALTCVSGACDNYTMVCICFSWALPFSPWPWGNKDRRVIVWCLQYLSQTFQRSTKNCSPLNYRRNYGEKKRENLPDMKKTQLFSVSAQPSIKRFI